MILKKVTITPDIPLLPSDNVLLCTVTWVKVYVVLNVSPSTSQKKCDMMIGLSVWRPVLMSNSLFYCH